MVCETSSKDRTAIPLETKEKLLLYCRHECCLCDKKVSGAYERNIHHINKDRNDNRFENLTLLCPNCHALATRGDFTEEHLKTVRDAKIQKLGIKEFVETKEEAAIGFKTVFSLKLENLCQLLEREIGYPKVNDQIDELIMLVKERIEKWDVPSVRFATEELFMKLYKYSEQKGFCELYIIFEDLFNYAYSQRKYILGVMISVFNLILFGSWVPDYDIEKGEKAAKVMLRLGIDFLDRDVQISEDCLVAIDNLAGDMFEPEILSKEVLLCAQAFEKIPKNPKLKDFVETYSEWIRINDEYSWDAENFTYLIESMKYAKSEESKYEVNTDNFNRQFLLPALELNIEKQIQEFVDFLEHSESEEYKGDIEFHTNFTTELLARVILSYESVRPQISKEIEQRVKETNNNYAIKEFNRLVDHSHLLRKIYRGSEMITTFAELIRFLENNADMENLNIGVTTYGLSWIDFEKKLNETEKKAINETSQKYALQKDAEFELDDQRLTFLMDTLVWLGDDRHDMRKLLDFLKEINNIATIENLTTGMEFKLRHLASLSK